MDSVYHCYHRGKDGQLLFYCDPDRLVYYSINSILAAKHHIKVLAITLMFNHVHLLVRAPSIPVLRKYFREVACTYTCEFNRIRGAGGPVFSKRSGIAAKKTTKKCKSCYAYLANNPVEKKLCHRGVEDRWTFVAYAGSPFPFSKPLALRFASKRFRRALNVVYGMRRKGEILRHRMLEHLYAGLSSDESRQLTDAIIRIYSVTDYDAVLRLYGSYEKMLLAFDSNTGEEYDIDESWEVDSDRAYVYLCGLLQHRGYNLLEKDFLQDPPVHQFTALMRESGATPYQIARFFHLPPKRSI